MRQSTPSRGGRAESARYMVYEWLKALGLGVMLRREPCELRNTVGARVPGCLYVHT